MNKPDEQWRQELTREQYNVLRRGHTEPAFTGAYVHVSQDGAYHCAGCGSELFRSAAKSESAWLAEPSLRRPSPRQSKPEDWTRARSCAAPRCSAATAAAILATSSATGSDTDW